LFSETDVNDMNFGGLVSDVELILTDEEMERDGENTITLNTEGGRVKDFKTLIKWVEECSVSGDSAIQRGHHQQTWKKFYKRLRKVVYESGGILRYEDQKGNPLDVVKADNTDPIVIDLNSLSAKPELQRFVVATVLRQLIDARTGIKRQEGLRFLVMLDELNRFAPRGANDPITRLIELVASEMRSQGLILLGAQQQASKVSEKIIENAGIKALGKTGTIELAATVWKGLSNSAKRKAESLRKDEKLIIQDNFREPLHVRVPMPVWAMNPEEVDTSGTESSDNNDLDGLIED
jgi:DNA helicase HerA-like ATPase